jgi:uncharacterized protein (TIGR03067 family)
MRSKVPALVGFCLVVGGVAGQGDGKDDAKQIEGTWAVASVVKAGKKKDTEGENIRFTFKAGKLTFQKGDETKQGAYKIDPAKKPKHIDLTVEETDLQGIYEFKGATLRLCLGAPGQDRPTAFKSDESNPTILIDLAREKAKKNK